MRPKSASHYFHKSQPVADTSNVESTLYSEGVQSKPEMLPAGTEIVADCTGPVHRQFKASEKSWKKSETNLHHVVTQSAESLGHSRANSFRKASPNHHSYSAIRENQRQFLAQRFSLLRKMSPKIYADCFVRPALQYFLASLCDVKVEPEERQRLGVRYPQTPEVKKLLKRLEDEKPISATGFQLNALLSALKEILSSFPGGIFVDISEEFYQISISSRLRITVVYLHGLLEALPYFLRQFVYLICRSLRNVVSQCSGSQDDSYTDLLLMFTPVLFPSAARLTLVMVDCCEQVFQPVVWLDQNNNAWHPLSEEESFFYQILASLGRLEETLNDESDDETNGNFVASDNLSEHGTNAVKPVNQKFYQFAYLENNT